MFAPSVCTAIAGSGCYVGLGDVRSRGFDLEGRVGMPTANRKPRRTVCVRCAMYDTGIMYPLVVVWAWGGDPGALLAGVVPEMYPRYGG